MVHLTREDRKALTLLLTPSWLSGLIAVSIGLLITGGVIAAFTVSNSAVQQQLVAWQQSQPEQPATESNAYAATSDKPSLQNNWPLIILWALVGLVVYSIAISVVRSLSRAAALKQSLNYVHARRDLLLRNAAEHVALRIVALVVLVMLVNVFFKQVVPYSITAAHASAADFFTLDGLLYLVLSCVVVVISLHCITIFLRLSLGKVRVFSDL